MECLRGVHFSGSLFDPLPHVFFPGEKRRSEATLWTLKVGGEMRVKQRRCYCELALAVLESSSSAWTLTSTCTTQAPLQLISLCCNLGRGYKLRQQTKSAWDSKQASGIIVHVCPCHVFCWRGLQMDFRLSLVLGFQDFCHGWHHSTDTGIALLAFGGLLVLMLYHWDIPYWMVTHYFDNQQVMLQSL